MKRNGSLGFALVLLFLFATPGWGAGGDLRWSYPTDAPVVSSSAIGVDGTIYVGTARLGGAEATYLYAINPDGTEKWSFPTGDVRSAPTISADGTIYVVTGDDELVAVDPEGNEKWTWAAANIGDSSVAVGYDGTIYVRSLDGVLHAVNPDGTEDWSLPFAAGLTTSPVIGPDGTVYVGCADSNLYAINPDGTENWGFLTGGEVYAAPAIGPDGTLYFGTTDERFYAVAPDGFLVWEFAGSGPFPQTPAIGCDGMIYFGNNGGSFWALNSDGTDAWNKTVDSWSSVAIGADCTLYVGRGDSLRAINHLTQLNRWIFDMGADADTFPVIGVDGTVYIGSHDGALYAVESESTGVACTAWPMARHDVGGGGLGMGLTARTFGGVHHDGATSIEQTADCGSIVAGSTTSFGAGSQDAWIVKLDAAGRVEWERTYGGETIDGVSTIQPTSDGGYIAGGATDVSSGAGAGDVWVLKLDAVGNVTWQGTYGGVQADTLNAILEIGDGFVIAGATASFGALIQDDAWVLRIDANGTLVQQRTYGSPDGGEAAADIRQTVDDGFIFTGPTYSFGAGNGDAWVVKLNADLSVAWERTYGGPEAEFGSVVRPVPDGSGYYVAGTTWIEVPADQDAWLMRLDPLGEVVWQQSYPQVGHEIVRDFEVTPDQGVVMVGSSEMAYTPPVVDGWIAKIDPAGAIAWRRTYAGEELEDLESFASVAVSFGGEFLIAGQTDSTGFGASEMLLLRVDAAGGEPAACGVLEPGITAASPTTFVTAVTTSTHGFSGASVAATAVTPEDSRGVMFDVCNPWLITIGVQKTGQVTSYAAGDDGHIQAGIEWPEPRFTDNGDGTVLDNLTGLVWLKDADCFVELEWEATFVTTDDLNDHPENYSCADYVPDPGADRWRVPNLNELESLLSAEATVQSVWLNGQGFENVQPDRYWSSGTCRPENHTMAWSVDMDQGPYARTSKGDTLLLWPVRGGQQNYIDFNYPANIPKTGTVLSDYPGDDGAVRWGVAWPDPRFSEIGDGTVIDNLTGLIWLQDATCLGQTDWPGAFDAVAALNAAGSGSCVTVDGIDDWTVPNRKQLLSLMDRGESRPVLVDGHPFLNVGSYSVWWTSTVDPTQTTPQGEPFAWTLSVGFGTISSESTTSSFPWVWPVRARQGSTPAVAGLGEDLRIGRAGAGEITLSWSGSCLATDTDFEIYAGTIDDFASHVPLLCSTGGMTSVTLTPSAGDVYYLVVPANASVEGSYGVDGDGNERPASASACKTQSVGECPP